MTTDSVELRPLLIALFGTGPESERWARALRGVDGVEIERFGEASDEQLLAALSRDDIDTIALTGPTLDAAGTIKRALLSGRHVFVAHPPALASKQLVALSELARRRSRVLLFDTGAAEDPRIDFVRKMTAGPHALWRPRYVRSLRTGAQEVRTLDELAVKDIAFVLRLLGDTPVAVSAVAPRLDDETGAADVVMATLIYPGGPAARIDVSLVEPEARHEVVIACQGRTLVLDEFNARAPLQILASGRHRGPQQSAWGETVSEHPAEDLVERLPRLASAFCVAVRSRDVGASNAGEVASAAAVWEAARTSMENGGEPVELNPTPLTEATRPVLQVIAGGGRGDGVSAAALRIVPPRKVVETPLSSA